MDICDEMAALAEIEAAERRRPVKPTFAVAAGRMIDLRTASLTEAGRHRLVMLRRAAMGKVVRIGEK